MKNSILLLDPEFDPNTAPHCNLLLKITHDSFSYAIINQENKRLKAVFDEQECDDMTQTIKRNLKNDPYLKCSFKEVKITISTDNSLTIPNDLYNSESLNAYSNFFSGKNTGKTHARPNAHFNFTSVFNLEPELELELDQQFQKARKFEHHTALVSMAESISNGLCIDFTARSFSMIQVRDNKLIYKNNFEIENAEEFNYFLLLVIKQLHIQTAETPVYLSGIINDNDANYRVVQKYFSSINFNLPPDQNLDCTILEDMPAYYYSNLLAIDLCV